MLRVAAIPLRPPIHSLLVPVVTTILRMVGDIYNYWGRGVAVGVSGGAVSRFVCPTRAGQLREPGLLQSAL
jgi:hypothetical protein